jgi:hypothetical protein
MYNEHMTTKKKDTNMTDQQQTQQQQVPAPQLVQDRKTGECYDPQQRFDEMMNKPEILAVFKRLSVR